MSDPSPESSKDPFQLCGSTIEGKYRVASVIGDGGFGVVYRGVHKGFGELIAIKCLKMPRDLDDKQREGLLEQLREEGRLLHRLSKATSGIVQALDVGAFTTPSGDWVPYLVLEWLEGETLGEHLHKRGERGEAPYSLAESINLLTPAARALAVAHKQKIAHRDVKPPNLFVTQSGGQQTVKVLDFGIAKVLTETPSLTEALAKTNLGPSAFTPRYGAPEQFNKQRGATGPWTDVFALALILVEVMTGKKALDGDDPTQLYIASADPTTRPTPRARGAVVPDAVEQVLEKALSIEPKYRYPDAGEFWDALVAAANVGGTTTTTGARSAVPITPPAASVAQISGMMGTGEFASHVKLDVQIEEKPKLPGMSLQATMPAESMTEAPSQKPMVVVHPAAPAPLVAGKKTAREDSMAETPNAARQAASPAPAAAAKGVPVTLQQAEATKTPENKGSSRSVWPWILGVVLLGGGGAGAFMFLSDSGSHKKPLVSSARPTATGSAAPHHSAGPKPTASAAVIPRASATASAAPFTPPIDMALIAAGSLKMGAGDAQRDVTISRPFYIDRAEVTVRDDEQCVTQRMCSAAEHVALTAESAGADAAVEAPAAITKFEETALKRCNDNPSRKALDHPMNCVDFSQAESFCRWRGRRLPTEAEWELAARGTEGRAYPWGQTPRHATALATTRAVLAGRRTRRRPPARARATRPIAHPRASSISGAMCPSG